MYFTFTETLVSLVLLCVSVSGQEYNFEADERAPRYIAAAAEQRPTPVPILKQVNRHNEDGSYTYGFEAADGSFKIETKLPDGDVKGKYGYKDDTGKLRVIEYGANKYGFQPSGEGITVAPPTYVDESKQQIYAEEPLHVKQVQPKRPKYKLQPVEIDNYDYEDEPAPVPVRQPAPRPSTSLGLGAYRSQPVTVAPYQQQPYFSQNDDAAIYRRQFDQPSNYGPKPQKQSAFSNPPQEDYSLFRPAPQFKQNLNFRPLNSIQYDQPTARPIQYSQAINYGNYQQEQQIQAPQPIYYQKPVTEPKAYNQPQKPFSMLDQLIKEYGLPQGGAAPLHDITFGTY